MKKEKKRTSSSNESPTDNEHRQSVRESTNEGTRDDNETTENRSGTTTELVADPTVEGREKQGGEVRGCRDDTESVAFGLRRA
jgi:hypothetical protein